MKVSAIILNWNRHQDTVLAVESVLAQDYGDFEVIVWDNGSTDNSHDILTKRFGKDPRVTLSFAGENLGPSIGRNRACDQAAGDIFMFLDSDSILETPSSLTLVAKQMLDDPTTAALNLEIRTPDDKVLWPYHREQSSWCENIFEITRVDGCGVAFHRTPFELAGGFPEHFGYGAEEHYLARRCIGLGYKVLYFPKAHVIHAAVPSGRTNDQFATMIRNHIWMSLELFRMPWALVSAANMVCAYLKDAIVNKRIKEFLHGVTIAITGFRLSRRQPFSREQWQRFRSIIREDKRLALKP